MSPNNLVVTAQERDGVHVLRLAGELDYDSVETLAAALPSGPACVMLELAEVKFVDSSGLAMLIRADRGLRAAGGWLRLAGAAPQLRRLLQITNLDRQFPPYESSSAQ